MLIYNANHTISFSIFEKFPELLCTMSTRALGDLNIGTRPVENAQVLLKLFAIKSQELVRMQQVHSTTVRNIDRLHENLIPKTDGLVTNKIGIYLTVRAADCVPLFFYDPVSKIWGVAHAGWKGTLGRVAEKVIREIGEIGGKVDDIRVAIGPHIGGCCYDVPERRAKLFVSEFGDCKGVFQNNGKRYLDLGLANKLVLTQAGILSENIDTPITCTSCQNELFFSYRKEGAHFGEVLGIIGIRK